MQSKALQSEWQSSLSLFLFLSLFLVFSLFLFLQDRNRETNPTFTALVGVDLRWSCAVHVVDLRLLLCGCTSGLPYAPPPIHLPGPSRNKIPRSVDITAHLCTRASRDCSVSMLVFCCRCCCCYLDPHLSLCADPKTQPVVQPCIPDQNFFERLRCHRKCVSHETTTQRRRRLCARTPHPICMSRGRRLPFADIPGLTNQRAAGMQQRGRR